MGIEPSDRKSIFNKKLKELISCIQSSEVLSDAYPTKMFATLLVGKKDGCQKVFNNGFSAFSSNFVHPGFLNAHASYLRMGLTDASAPLSGMLELIVPTREISKFINNYRKLILYLQ